MDSMKDRMLRGEPYRSDDAELQAGMARAAALHELYNSTGAEEVARRRSLLEELLDHVGEGVEIRPPFRCDYGAHISIGAGTFINFDCVMLDCAAIVLGARCQVAPRVQLLAATHPAAPGPRRAGWESAHPITIGDNVWLGAGAIVLPGVSIGDDTVVGAGAIVTRDLPPGVVAAGTPARVLRAVGD